MAGRERLRIVSERIEAFLEAERMQLASWTPVMLGGGIASWFLLPGFGYWIAAVGGCVAVALAGLAMMRWRPGARLATLTFWAALLIAAGLVLPWAKSALVGGPFLERPYYGVVQGRIVSRDDLPARAMTRLVLQTGAQEGLPPRVRINIPDDLFANPAARTALVPGAVVSVRARLLPPAGPALPYGYDFARTAWFEGLGASGSALSAPEIVTPGSGEGALTRWRRDLAAHIRQQVGGSAGAIAATLATGDRGAIPDQDAEAMRDSGLAHLLSISGLHVSAVIGATWFAIMRILALFPALALRIRLPVVAAVGGAAAGIGYTLLTGAEVPTLRACIAALLVLVALVAGRDPISMRLIACGAFLVLLFWPEALLGPSFQLSFAAVAAIVALHQSDPMKRFLGPREEGIGLRCGRYVAALFVTGLIIEFTLMPIALFHFHKAGLFGAIANLAAIPLATMVIMPLVALALVGELVGLGAPLWALAGWAIDLLLGLARTTAEQPGSVLRLPPMGRTAFALFVFGGLWLFLWMGRARFVGLLVMALGLVLLVTRPSPDILVMQGGGHAAFVAEDGRLVTARERIGDYNWQLLSEHAGFRGDPLPLRQWEQARCSADFCTVTMMRGGKTWAVLISMSRDYVPERALAAACRRADLVISDRALPYSCRPRWTRLDGPRLRREGGVSIRLASHDIVGVAELAGGHEWEMR